MAQLLEEIGSETELVCYEFIFGFGRYGWIQK